MEYLETQRLSGPSLVAPRPTLAAADLPYEFDLRPPQLGYAMRGWDFTRAELARAVNEHRLLNPALELGTNICPWNCSFCFTEDPQNVAGGKRRLPNEMSREERLRLIDAAADLGARTINV